MKRLRSLLVAGAIATAVLSFLKNRLSAPPPTDPGGWKPVDPA